MFEKLINKVQKNSDVIVLIFVARQSYINSKQVI